MSQRTRIFVYGTLKRGLSNHRYLAGQQFVGEARTAPGYRLVDCGGYPGMYAAPADGKGVSVRGEVWDVDDACRANLDVLEDVDRGLYTREPVQLAGEHATGTVQTYIYRWPVAGMKDAGEEWRE